MHRLYHLPLSPFCRKIRMVLAEKRVEIELIEEHPWEKRLDFLRLNPAGKVPVLITAEGFDNLGFQVNGDFLLNLFNWMTERPALIIVLCTTPMPLTISSM